MADDENVEEPLKVTVDCSGVVYTKGEFEKLLSKSLGDITNLPGK